MYLVLLLYQAGSTQVDFYLIEGRYRYGIGHVFVAPWLFPILEKYYLAVFVLLLLCFYDKCTTCVCCTPGFLLLLGRTYVL